MDRNVALSKPKRWYPQYAATRRTYCIAHGKYKDSYQTSSTTSMSRSAAVHYTVTPIAIRFYAIILFVHVAVIFIFLTWAWDHRFKTQEETIASCLQPHSR